MSMRWTICVIKSVAVGFGVLLMGLVALVVASELYGKYVLRLGPNEAVGWDPVSLFGQHWKVALLGIPVLIFQNKYEHTNDASDVHPHASCPSCVVGSSLVLTDTLRQDFILRSFSR